MSKITAGHIAFFAIGMSLVAVEIYDTFNTKAIETCAGESCPPRAFADVSEFLVRDRDGNVINIDVNAPETPAP